MRALCMLVLLLPGCLDLGRLRSAWDPSQDAGARDGSLDGAPPSDASLPDAPVADSPSVCACTRTGPYALAYDLAIASPRSGAPVSIDLGDVDEDGAPDVVLVTSDGATHLARSRWMLEEGCALVEHGAPSAYETTLAQTSAGMLVTAGVALPRLFITGSSDFSSEQLISMNWDGTRLTTDGLTHSLDWMAGPRSLGNVTEDGSDFSGVVLDRAPGSGDLIFFSEGSAIGARASFPSGATGMGVVTLDGARYLAIGQSTVPPLVLYPVMGLSLGEAAPVERTTLRVADAIAALPIDRLVYSDGTAKFATVSLRSRTEIASFDVGGGVRALATEDVDADGAPEVIVMRNGPPGIDIVSISDGGDMASLDEAFPLPWLPHGLAIADLEDDGAIEIVVVGPTDVRVHRRACAMR